MDGLKEAIVLGTQAVLFCCGNCVSTRVPGAINEGSSCFLVAPAGVSP